MENDPIAKFSFDVNPEALRQIISNGKLLEFADAVSKKAAEQITHQLVQHVAEAGLKTDGLSAATTGAKATFYSVTGPDGVDGYGTPRKPWLPPSSGNPVIVIVVTGPRQMTTAGSYAQA